MDGDTITAVLIMVGGVAIAFLAGYLIIRQKRLFIGPLVLLAGLTIVWIGSNMSVVYTTGETETIQTEWFDPNTATSPPVAP